MNRKWLIPVALVFLAIGASDGVATYLLVSERGFQELNPDWQDINEDPKVALWAWIPTHLPKVFIFVMVVIVLASFNPKLGVLGFVGLAGYYGFMVWNASVHWLVAG